MSSRVDPRIAIGLAIAMVTVGLATVPTAQAAKSPECQIESTFGDPCQAIEDPCKDSDGDCIPDKVEDCLAGEPAFPCDPNPQTEAQLSDCVKNCQSPDQDVPEVTLPRGDVIVTTPAAWLVVCTVDNVGVPQVTVGSETNCLLGTWSSTITPLVEEQDVRERDPVIGTLLTVTVHNGICELTTQATVYGDIGLQKNTKDVPCATLEVGPVSVGTA